MFCMSLTPNTSWHVTLWFPPPACPLPPCSTSPSFTWQLGTLGSFSASPALVLQLRSIFTQAHADWAAELLYMPCLIPFVAVSCVTLGLYRGELRGAGVAWWQPFATAWHKVAGVYTREVQSGNARQSAVSNRIGGLTSHLGCARFRALMKLSYVCVTQLLRGLGV
jgi:hypothetical protein